MSDICHRFFFGLQPSLPQRSEIARHRDAEAHRGYTLVSNPRLHLTLAVTQDFSSFPSQVPDLLTAIGAAIAIDPFVVKLDRLSGSANMRDNGRGSIALRPSARPAALGELSRQLCRRMRHHVLLRARWEFNPHTTLLYWQGQPFLVPIEPICWTAIDFVLIHSLVGATQHIELGRWPLCSGQAALPFADAG